MSRLFALFILALGLSTTTAAQTPVDLFAPGSGNHWSFDVEQVGWEGATGPGPSYQVEWVSAGMDMDDDGDENPVYLVISRDQRGARVKPCVFLDRENADQGTTTIQIWHNAPWACGPFDGVPISPYGWYLTADRAGMADREIDVGGELHTVPVVPGEFEYATLVGPRPQPGWDIYSYRVSASLSPDIGLVDFVYRVGYPNRPVDDDFRVSSRLVGANVSGGTYGQPRLQTAENPDIVFALDVGTEWIYDVSRWTGDRDTADVQVEEERWSVTGALGGGRFRIATAVGETVRTCEAETQIIGEVASMQLRGQDCVLADSLFFAHGDRIEGGGAEYRFLPVRTSFLAAPGPSRSWVLGGPLVEAPGSYGTYGGNAAKLATWVASRTVEYEVAQGLGLYRVLQSHTASGGGSAQGRTTSTERVLRYAKVGGVEYGSRFIASEEVASPNELTIRAGPNPADEFVTVWVTHGSREQDVELIVSDVLGRTVQSAHTRAGERIRLDVSGLPPGVYIVSANADRQRVQTRLVVQR